MRSRNVKPQPFCDRISLLRPSQDTTAILCSQWFWPHFSHTSLSLYGSESWGWVGHHSWGNGKHTPNRQPMVVLPLGSAQRVSHHSALCRKRSRLTVFGHHDGVRWAGYNWVWAQLLAFFGVKQDQHEAFGTQENRRDYSRTGTICVGILEVLQHKPGAPMGCMEQHGLGTWASPLPVFRNHWCWSGGHFIRFFSLL